jgi:transcriptional regulator with XRE-family HTH domain
MFYDWLGDEMAKKGLTETSLAAAVGVTQQAVNKWRKHPETLTLRRCAQIALVLGMPVRASGKMLNGETTRAILTNSRRTWTGARPKSRLSNQALLI